PYQFKQPLFPSFLFYLDVNPLVHVAPEEFRSHAVSFSAGFFRPARRRLHHAAITAAAHREAPFRQPATQLARLRVVRVAFARARAAKYRHDPFVVHAFLDCFRIYFFTSSRQILPPWPYTVHPARRAPHDPSRSGCCSGTRKSDAF